MGPFLGEGEGGFDEVSKPYASRGVTESLRAERVEERPAARVEEESQGEDEDWERFCVGCGGGQGVGLCVV